MVNKTKILSDLSKIAVDAMSTFSGIKKEIETIVKLKVDNAINKMNLVKRDEFEVLKKIVQKISLEKSNHKKKKKSVKQNKNKKKKISKK
jgi:BMFP domain-containing protein YqiC